MENIEVFDNGGVTFDRYLVFIGNSVFTMSSNPESPQGVDMYAGDRGQGYQGLEKNRVAFDVLPLSVRVAIKRRVYGTC